MDENKIEKLFSKIDSYKDEIIDMQAKLTAIPAIAPESGGNGEWAKTKLIREYMEKIGFDKIEEFNAPDLRVPEKTRPNLLGMVYGADRSRTIWIMAHTDVVPEGDRKLWDSDPFKIKIEDDKIFGRGTEDNHQAIITSLFSIRAVRELKITPKYNLGAIMVADEETGSKYGIAYLLEKAKKHFSKDDLIIVPDAGTPDAKMIEVAEKGIVWLKIAVEGKQCHASMPAKGVNAHRAGAELIIKLGNLYNDFPHKDPVFDPPISTFEPTKKENNVPNINTIPGEDVFYMDMRILPEYSIEEVLKKIKGYAREIEEKNGVKIGFEESQRSEAAPATPTDAPIVLALKKAIKKVYRTEAEPIGIGGGTVAAFFRMAGYNAAVWSRVDDVPHEPNEFCRISNLIGDTKVFAHIFMQ